MRAGIRGSIVCISSSPGVIACAFHKGGVNNFARAAAIDLAPYGIRVNTFMPTMVTADNPELAGVGRPGGPARPRGIGGEGGDEPWRRPARWQGERPPPVPTGTTGTPTDIGCCIAWMCSDLARLVTGCDFVVDGGGRARNFAHLPAAPEDLVGPPRW